jgi:hypothetical protein
MQIQKIWRAWAAWTLLAACLLLVAHWNDLSFRSIVPDPATHVLIHWWLAAFIAGIVVAWISGLILVITDSRYSRRSRVLWLVVAWFIPPALFAYWLLRVEWSPRHIGPAGPHAGV